MTNQQSNSTKGPIETKCVDTGPALARVIKGPCSALSPSGMYACWKPKGHDGEHGSQTCCDDGHDFGVTWEQTVQSKGSAPNREALAQVIHDGYCGGNHRLYDCSEMLHGATLAAADDVNTFLERLGTQQALRPTPTGGSDPAYDSIFPYPTFLCRTHNIGNRENGMGLHINNPNCHVVIEWPKWVDKNAEPK